MMIRRFQENQQTFIKTSQHWVPARICLLMLIFLISPFSILPSYCQNTFQKLFGDNLSNSSEFVYDATMDKIGNVYIVGSNSIGTFNIAKVDSIGNTLWMKSFDQNLCAINKICNADDSCFIISGITNIGQNYLCKIDSSGTIIWSSYFDAIQYGSTVDFIYEDNSQNLITGGKIYYYDSTSTYTETGYVNKFDLNGNLIFHRKVNGTQSSNFKNLIQLDNSNYMIIGRAGNNFLAQFDVFLIEMDSSGNLIRSKVFGSIANEYGLKLLKDANSIVLVAVDDNGTPDFTPEFIRIDDNWNIMSNNKIMFNATEIPEDIIPWSNNSFLVAANGPMIYNIDSTFTYQYGMNYGYSGFNRILSRVFNLGNNRIEAVGRNLQNPDILILRTDSIMNAGCYSFQTISFSNTSPVLTSDTIAIQLSGTTFPIISGNDSLVNNPWQEWMLCNSVTLVDEIYTGDFNTLKLFPNPFSEEIKIEYPNHPQELIKYEVSDLMGKVLTHGRLIENKINLEILADGLYIIKFHFMDQTEITRKIIKQH